MAEAPDKKVAQTSLELDESQGAHYDGGIRYLLMRPDVLMGLVKNLQADYRSIALQAFEQSAFENGKASMLQYNTLDFAGTGEALDHFCHKGTALGWGRWSHDTDEIGNPIFTVTNSPFAAGYGPGDQRVCAPIVGIIRASMSVFFGQECSVAETHCAAQGGDCCKFEVSFLRQPVATYS